MNEMAFDQNKYLREAQDYLTIEKDGQKQLIVGIDYLSENHSREEIVRFLKDYLREKEKQLKELILGDKSSNKIDQTVAVMFRIHMAISIIEERMEVKQIVELKRGTAESGKFLKGNRSSHISARGGQDQNHDGENRDIGQDVRSAA
jgi:hypothetical protein